jgi:hypothetical protein
LKDDVQEAILAVYAAIESASSSGIIDPDLDAGVIAAEGVLTVAEGALWAAELICHGIAQTVTHRESSEYISLYSAYSPAPTYDITDVLDITSTHPSSASHQAAADDAERHVTTFNQYGGGDTLHTFTVNQTCNVDIMMAAAGGGASFGLGGGGGAGAYLFYEDFQLSPGNYACSVGQGGSAGTSTDEPGRTGGPCSFMRVDESGNIDTHATVYGGTGGSAQSLLSSGYPPEATTFGGSTGGGDGSAQTAPHSQLTNVIARGEPFDGTLLYGGLVPSVLTSLGGAGGYLSGHYHYGGGGGGAGSPGTSGSASNSTGGVGGSGVVNNGITYCVGGNGGGLNLPHTAASPSTLGSGGHGAKNGVIGSSGTSGRIQIFVKSVV